MSHTTNRKKLKNCNNQNWKQQEFKILIQSFQASTTFAAMNETTEEIKWNKMGKFWLRYLIKRWEIIRDVPILALLAFSITAFAAIAANTTTAGHINCGIFFGKNGFLVRRRWWWNYSSSSCCCCIPSQSSASYPASTATTTALLLWCWEKQTISHLLFLKLIED